MPKGSGWDDLSGCPYGELDSATDAFGSFGGYVLSEFSAPLLRLMKAREYMHLKWFKEGKQVRQMKTLTGAEIVIECLKEQGGRHGVRLSGRRDPQHL